MSEEDISFWRETPKARLIEGVYDKICPICNKSDQLIPIIYGEPTEKTFRDAEKSKVILGGCAIILDRSPDYRCQRDLVEFRVKHK